MGRGHGGGRPRTGRAAGSSTPRVHPLWTFTRETCPCTHFIVAEILILVGCAIPPAPAVLASTRVSGRLKRVQGHSSPVNGVRRGRERGGSSGIAYKTVNKKDTLHIKHCIIRTLCTYTVCGA